MTTLHHQTWDSKAVLLHLPILVRECPVCGTPMACRNGGPGRKREYCSDDCRLLKNAIRRLDKLVLRVKGKSSETAWRGLRGEVMGVMNQRSLSKERLAADEATPWASRVQEAVPQATLATIQASLQGLMDSQPDSWVAVLAQASEYGLTLAIPEPPTPQPLEAWTRVEASLHFPLVIRATEVRSGDTVYLPATSTLVQVASLHRRTVFGNIVKTQTGLTVNLSIQDRTILLSR